MFDSFMTLIAPHSCLSCGRLGRLLCEACHNVYVESREAICIGCGIAVEDGPCNGCAAEWQVERAFVFGERSGVVKALIDEYKYSYKRAASYDLARLASATMPYGVKAVVVPVPTIAASIRKRGFDHAALLARRFARDCKIAYAPLLSRRNTSIQHKASKYQRITQIQDAFALKRAADPNLLYIIIDDIVTTGASLRSAAKTLRASGATRIWVVALARQPLDFPLDAKR